MGAAEQQIFMGQWYGFLGNVERLGTRKIQQRGGAFVGELRPLFAEVIGELQSDAGGAAFREAVTLQENDDEASQMLIFLGREMQFFDRLVSSLRLEDEQQNDSNDIGEALGTAKTIKESVEKWLGKRLSRRWTNLLTILNELLSILKGG